MTLQQFLDQFQKEVEADIGEGQLDREDFQHMFIIFCEMIEEADGLHQ
jgi:hypothetical protein